MILDLFKYYAPKYKNKENISFHLEKAIFFQDPTKFNDPWDCKAPKFELPSLKSALKEIWLNFLKGEGENKTEWEKINNLSRPEIKKCIQNILDQAFIKQRPNIGVFSSSFIPDSELMWAHYASSHEGYALHFQLDTDQYPFSQTATKKIGPVPVFYKEERDLVPINEYFENGKKIIFNMVSFKSKSWEYECEFRLLRSHGGGYELIPPNFLKSIIVGLKTKNKLRSKLKQIGEELDLDVFQTVMNETFYKIDIPGLGINGIDGQNTYTKLINENFMKKYI